MEHPAGESMTIPEQSMSVREIFERYRIGAPLDIVARDIDSGDDEDFSDYDPTFNGHNDIVDVYEASIDLQLRNEMRRRKSEESVSEERSEERNDSSDSAEASDDDNKG